MNIGSGFTYISVLNALSASNAQIVYSAGSIHIVGDSLEPSGYTAALTFPHTTVRNESNTKRGEVKLETSQDERDNPRLCGTEEERLQCLRAVSTVGNKEKLLSSGKINTQGKQQGQRQRAKRKIRGWGGGGG